MSLGPWWWLGVLFGCFCLGKRLALGRGAFGTDLVDLGPSRRVEPGTTGSGGVQTRRILPV